MSSRKHPCRAITPGMASFVLLAATIPLHAAGTFIDLGAGDTADVSSDGTLVGGNDAGGGFVWTQADGKNMIGSVVVGVDHYNDGAGNTVIAAGNDVTGDPGKARVWLGLPDGTGPGWAALPKEGGANDWQARGLGVASDSSDYWVPGSTLNNDGDGGTDDHRGAVRYKKSSDSATSIQIPAGGHDNSFFFGASNTGVFAGRYQYTGSPPTGGSRQAMRSSGVALNPLVAPRASNNEGQASRYASNAAVVGGWSKYDDALSAYRQATFWTNADLGGNDQPQAVPFLPGTNYSEVTAINGDGTIMAGYTYYESLAFGGADGPRMTYIWMCQSSHNLQDLLEDVYGLDLGGMTLTDVTGISDDGLVLCGKGTVASVVHGWVVILPQIDCLGACCAGGACTETFEASCTGDYQGDGTTCAETSCCSDPFADADGDGDADQEDFGVVQACITGPGGGVLPGCECFNRDGDDDVDADDIGSSVTPNTFEGCASGPTVPANPACDD